MKKGFTLLELLSVMAIMGIVSTIAIMGYFAVMRGSAVRGTAEHLSQMIMLARQSAIMQGKKTAVIFDQDLTNAWYYVCRYDGVITDCYGEWVGDEYADWTTNAFLGAMMFNLGVNPPRYGRVYQVDTVNERIAVRSEDGGNLFTTVLEQYGWELYPPVSLPRGMQFGTSLSTAPRPLIFKPDGSAEYGLQVDIYEQVKLSGTPACTIEIECFRQLTINVERL